LLIKDSLQQQRLEWVFGVSMIKTESKYRSTKYQYGHETIIRVNDQSVNYITTLASSIGAGNMICVLERLLTQKGRSDEFCLKAIKDLLSLCIKDQAIADYIHKQSPPTYQLSRYTDWFQQYIQGIIDDNEKYSNNASSYSATNYMQSKIILTEKCHKKYQQWRQEVFAKFE
jgi:hypothetical protein